MITWAISLWARSLTRVYPLQPDNITGLYIAGIVADVLILFFAAVIIRGWPTFKAR